MEIPTIKIPPIQEITTISIPLPTADVPSYTPMVVPPSDLREPEGTKPVETVDPPKPTLPPPFPPYPLPSPDILVPTVITAVTAVAATTVATPIIQDIKEKITKFLMIGSQKMIIFIKLPLEKNINCLAL